MDYLGALLIVWWLLSVNKGPERFFFIHTYIHSSTLVSSMWGVIMRKSLVNGSSPFAWWTINLLWQCRSNCITKQYVFYLLQCVYVYIHVLPGRDAIFDGTWCDSMEPDESKGIHFLMRVLTRLGSGLAWQAVAAKQVRLTPTNSGECQFRLIFSWFTLSHISSQ